MVGWSSTLGAAICGVLHTTHFLDWLPSIFIVLFTAVVVGIRINDMGLVLRARWILCLSYVWDAT